VVGVRECIVDNLPCSLLINVLLINHNPQQLHNSQRRMRVIELHGGLLGEFLPLELNAIELGIRLVPSDDILDCSRDQQVLLFQPELFSLVC
jgi:hypothetical protein